MAIRDITLMVEKMNNEIKTWRKLFIQRIFSEKFSNIPDCYKNRLEAYFMSILSESFTDPLDEFHNCISVLLQNIESQS